MYKLLKRYEKGALSQSKVILLFQLLIDSGVVWCLPGALYGMKANQLIKQGDCIKC